MLFTGAAGALTDILQLFSLIHTPVGTFESIKRVSSQLLALVFGYILFREEMTKPKLIGIAILSVGVPLIVL